MPDPQQQAFSDITPIPQTFSNVQPVNASAAIPDEDTGIWAGIKRNTAGAVAGIYHAFTDPATDSEKAALAQKVQDEKAWQAAHGYDPNQVPDTLATNPSRITLAYHRLIDAPAGQLSSKGSDEVSAAKELLAHGDIAKGANAYLSGRVDQGLATIPMAGPWINSVAERAEKGDLSGAATDIASAVALSNAKEIKNKVASTASNVWSKVSPSAAFEKVLGSKLSAAEADTPRPGGQIQPALNNTPREVLQHAADEGIKLTPGQATENAGAQQAQKVGVNSLIGGKELQAALNENKTKFGQSINNFMDDVDPKRAGLSAESAGQQIRDTQSTAKSVSHDNAAQGYDKIDYLMDRPVNPQPISMAWNQLKQNLPMGAEEQILAQTPRSMRAVVSDLLSGNPEGFKPTFNQSIQLRKFFRDLGDTDGLPNQTQSMFKQMSGVVDKAMESSAGDDVDAWRSANAGWKDYATKYGDPQSILYKIGRTQDPTRIVTMLQNAPATDILTVKQEMGDAALEPLRRQVVQDIAQSRFNVGHDGIGGYSDPYLKSLFPAEQVKELYLKGDLANRLKYDPNPSGTAGGVQTLEALKIGNQAKTSIAAKLSMPRDPLSYLPDISSRNAMPQPISIGERQPLAATGTTGPQPPNLQGGPRSMFGGRFNPSDVEAAARSNAKILAIRDLDTAIVNETNPMEKARLQRHRMDLVNE